VTRRRVALLVTVSLLGPWTVSCSGGFGMPRGATDQGRDIFGVWQVFIVAAIAVALIVYGLIGWSLIRYRRRRADPPEMRGAGFREHRSLEVVYVAIPLALVVVLFTVSVRANDRVTSTTRHPDVAVRVQAFTWGWRFSYPGFSVVSEPSGPDVAGPELVLPIGRTTQIELVSDDVIHAFWVPGFLFKRDAIPGITQVFDVTPTVVGTYHGACAEFCGLNHAYMVFTVRVVSDSDFAAWLAEQRAAT
jgi:cytochrome c oxidase subunit 2